MEAELYSMHPARSFKTSEPTEDDTKDEDFMGPLVEAKSPIVKAKSQPRKARPRMKKESLKMTDFFGKQG